jgi:hypothetical protein
MCRSQFLCKSDGHGGQIQVDQARCGGIQYTLIEDDRTNGCIIGEHGDQEIGTCDVRGSRGRFCTFCDQLLDRLGRAIPDAHLMSCSDQAFCYDLAHFAKADESDIHCDLQRPRTQCQADSVRGKLAQASLPLMGVASAASQNFCRLRVSMLRR